MRHQKRIIKARELLSTESLNRVKMNFICISWFESCNDSDPCLDNEGCFVPSVPFLCTNILLFLYWEFSVAGVLTVIGRSMLNILLKRQTEYLYEVTSVKVNKLIKSKPQWLYRKKVQQMLDQFKRGGLLKMQFLLLSTCLKSKRRFAFEKNTFKIAGHFVSCLYIYFNNMLNFLQYIFEVVQLRLIFKLDMALTHTVCISNLIWKQTSLEALDQ